MNRYNADLSKIYALWPRLSRLQRLNIIAKISYYRIKNSQIVNEKTSTMLDSMLVGYLAAQILENDIIGVVIGFLFLSYYTTARYIIRG